MRLVLDTHVWLDWLVFDDPSVAPLREAAAAGRVEIVVDAACEEELARVLGRGFAKRALDARAQEACIGECRRRAKRVEVNLPEAERRALPVCKDPDDQKFLELALAAGADYLITKDRALLELARRKTRRVPFGIVAPKDLKI